MGNITGNVFTKEERNLKRFYGDFIGLARTGLMVTKKPQDKSQMILSHIKSNIGPLAPGITYTICSDEAVGDERPYVVFAVSSEESRE